MTLPTDFRDSNGLACIGHSCQFSDRNREPGLVHLYSSPMFLERLRRHVHSNSLSSGHTIPQSFGVNEHIQFTLEMEEDNSLHSWTSYCTTNQMDPYMSVYRKPTHTNRYLDFSHHPLEHKISVVTTLFSHANSHPLCCKESHLSKKLKINGYPQRFVSKLRGNEIFKAR